MKVNIKRVDSSMELPKYETLGSVGFDLYARLDSVIEPGNIKVIPSNLIVQVPPGYMLMLASRSSAPRKFGIMPPHGIGVIDLDYHGPQDEIGIQVYNFTNKTVHIAKATKIAQGIFVKVDRFEFEELNQGNFKNISRGGFGSTDNIKNNEKR